LNKQTPWLRIALEGVVIVGSILLAFGIDAWWAGWQDRGELQELMFSLRDDLASDRLALIEKIESQEAMADRVARLLAMTDVELRTVSADSLDRFGFAIQGYETFDSQSGTLDGLIAGGRTSSLPSRAISAALLSWKARVDDLEEETEAIRAAVDAAGWRLSELGGPWDSQDFPVIARTGGALPRLPAPDMTVVHDPELRAHLRRKQFLLLVYLVELIPLLEQTDAILEMLDEALE